MAMKAYKSYKNVDLPWLKRVPEHWEVKRIRQVLRERKERNFPIKTKNILSLTNTRGVIPYEDKGNVGNKSKSDLGDYFLAYPGDIVLNSMNVVIGSVGLSAYFGAISPVYYALYNTDPNSSISYFNTIFSSKIFQKSLKCLGNGILDIRKRISAYDLKNVMIPVPPKEEQDQIVRYLDWQNSRLNKLINAKKKEIALLEEQKQALISQAVTKGLDPHAPLKDSGIDWIGQIPEHWQYSTLGKLTDIILGKMLTPRKKTAQDSLQEYLCARDIHFDNINTENLKQMYFSPSELKQYRVKNGDLLIVEGGAAGTSAIIENIGDRKIMVQNSVHILRSRSKLLNKYVYFWMYSLVRSSYISFCANVTTIPHYTKDKVKSTPIPVPPIKEQQDVIAYLDGVTNTIDETIANIALSISLLQEYRTRLVADVVTGQIDVRHITIPNYETVPETIDQPETTEDDSTISAEDQ